MVRNFVLSLFWDFIWLWKFWNFLSKKLINLWHVYNSSHIKNIHCHLIFRTKFRMFSLIQSLTIISKLHNQLYWHYIRTFPLKTLNSMRFSIKVSTANFKWTLTNLTPDVQFITLQGHKVSLISISVEKSRVVNSAAGEKNAGDKKPHFCRINIH